MPSFTAPFWCHVCNRGFPEIVDYAQHLLVHPGRSDDEIARAQAIMAPPVAIAADVESTDGDTIPNPSLTVEPEASPLDAPGTPVEWADCTIGVPLPAGASDPVFVETPTEIPVSAPTGEALA